MIAHFERTDKKFNFKFIFEIIAKQRERGEREFCNSGTRKYAKPKVDVVFLQQLIEISLISNKKTKWKC